MFSFPAVNSVFEPSRRDLSKPPANKSRTICDNQGEKKTKQTIFQSFQVYIYLEEGNLFNLLPRWV